MNLYLRLLQKKNYDKSQKNFFSNESSLGSQKFLDRIAEKQNKLDRGFHFFGAIRSDRNTPTEVGCVEKKTICFINDATLLSKKVHYIS